MGVQHPAVLTVLAFRPRCYREAFAEISWFCSFASNKWPCWCEKEARLSRVSFPHRLYHVSSTNSSIALSLCPTEELSL